MHRSTRGDHRPNIAILIAHRPAGCVTVYRLRRRETVRPFFGHVLSGGSELTLVLPVAGGALRLGDMGGHAGRKRAECTAGQPDCPLSSTTALLEHSMHCIATNVRCLLHRSCCLLLSDTSERYARRTRSERLSQQGGVGRQLQRPSDWTTSLPNRSTVQADQCSSHCEPFSQHHQSWHAHEHTSKARGIL